MATPTCSIEPNQKYAFIALSTRVDRALPRCLPLGGGAWATRKLPAGLDANWKEWIGSLRAERLGEHCNLFLCATLDSNQPAILNGENHQLSVTVRLLFDALMLTGNLELNHTPVLLTGAHERELVVRQISDLVRPLAAAGISPDAVNDDMLRGAARLTEGRLAFARATRYDRFARIWEIYDKALGEQSVHERLHDFCRCLEGFVLPDPGKTQRQFASRTELFVGPTHHDVMRRLYEMRSSVEHMHDYTFPDGVSERERRIEVMRMAALAQQLARLCIGRFLSTEALWPHYASACVLNAFWKLDASEQRKLWGPAIDLSELARRFNIRKMNNAILGLAQG